MTDIQNIKNVTDCVPLYLPHSLYLKPLAKMTISVSLPVNKTGKSISHLDIMEKLSAALKPDKFFVLKATKSTIDYIRFEAELEDRSRLRSAISRLDGVSLRVSGFSESFRVRATESKDEFPTRHDWDSFFRDASNMDEMKAGERPDTIHLTHLPIRWFCPRHMENDDNVKPSESIFKRIFEKFGSVRSVDIPICDPYRNKMNTDINGMKTFSYEHGVLFEAYVQFDEYMGFVRAMDEFRGMKLVRKFVDKTQAINIGVNFDKTKHLSDAQMQRRERVRKRLTQKAQSEEEERERKKKEELERLERERQKEEQLKLEELEKQREREEKRKEKHLKKIQEKGQIEISQKIRIEERKLMIAQRKLESIRILEQLFDRIKLKHEGKYSKYGDKGASKIDLRDRLVEKYKLATEKLLTEQKKKVEEIKTKTPLMGLLKRSRSRRSESSDGDEGKTKKKAVVNPSTTDAGVANALPAVGLNPLNPFKAVAALAAAGGAAPGTLPPGYPPEAASEWMKSFSMFPYVPPVFGGMSALYRQPTAFPVSMNYRGYAPRVRGRGRGGRGRGRGGYDSSYYNNYKNNYDDDQYGEDDYRKESYSRSRNRSRSRSYSRSRSRKRHYSKRSRSRSRSRSRTPSHSRSRQRRSRTRSRSERRTRSRSYTRSRSHSRSRSRSKSKSKARRNSRPREVSKSRKTPSRTRSRSPGQQRANKKLVSTRRSYSSDSSHSRSKSRSRTRSKRSWPRRGERSSAKKQIILETDKLVRSAEEMKRTIEKATLDRMRQEEREIQENFRHCKYNPTRSLSNTVNAESANAIVTSSENDVKNTKSNANSVSAEGTVADSPLGRKEGDERVERCCSRERVRKHSQRSSSHSRRNSFEREADAF